jgi:hypothetical protein
VNGPVLNSCVAGPEQRAEVTPQTDGGVAPKSSLIFAVSAGKQMTVLVGIMVKVVDMTLIANVLRYIQTPSFTIAV